MAAKKAKKKAATKTRGANRAANKALAKKKAATKKAHTKKAAKKKVAAKPPRPLLHALQTLFEEHGWSGNAIGRVASIAEGVSCPQGTVAHEITYKLPNGTWVSKTVCLPNTAAGLALLPTPKGSRRIGGLAGDAGKKDLPIAGLAGDPGKNDP